MKSIGKKILAATTLVSIMCLFGAGCDWGYDDYGYYGGHDGYRANEPYGYDRGEGYYAGDYYGHQHDWDRDHGEHDWDYHHGHDYDHHEDD